MGQAAISAILADPAFTCVLPTVLSVDDVREYAAASDQPLTADERQAVDALWERNFDHTDRYVMPLKSSV
jgi:aryl-alcohol dehydrogenase-like predicted oxidoreductase